MRKAVMFGCGNMGRALLNGWSQTPDMQFTVIDPANPDLGDMADTLTSPKTIAGDTFSLAVVSVKPQLIPVIVESAGDILRRSDLILSIAAGVSIASLERQLGPRPIIRMMPNMPASVGKGLSGLYANAACSDVHKALITELADRNGQSIWLDDEDKIDRFTAIAGSGPGYIFEFLRLFTKAAMAQGFSAEDARKLAIGTVAGSAEMAAQSDQSLEDLRKSVTSKNGTTQAGLEQFMRDDLLEQLLLDTAEAAYNRAVELR